MRSFFFSPDDILDGKKVCFVLNLAVKWDFRLWSNIVHFKTEMINSYFPLLNDVTIWVLVDFIPEAVSQYSFSQTMHSPSTRTKWVQLCFGSYPGICVWHRKTRRYVCFVDKIIWMIHQHRSEGYNVRSLVLTCSVELSRAMSKSVMSSRRTLC